MILKLLKLLDVLAVFFIALLNVLRTEYFAANLNFRMSRISIKFDIAFWQGLSSDFICAK